MEDPKKKDDSDEYVESAKTKGHLARLDAFLDALRKNGGKPLPFEINPSGTAAPDSRGAFRPAITLLEYDLDKDDPTKKRYNPKVLVDGPLGTVERMHVRWHYHELHSAVFTGADLVMISPPGTYSVFLIGKNDRAVSATRPPDRSEKLPNGDLVYESENIDVRFDAYLTSVSCKRLVIHGDMLTFCGKQINVDFRAQVSMISDRN